MLLIRKGARDRLCNQWATTTKHARRVRGRLLSITLNRLTRAEMDRSALLLGYGIALGHGWPGNFRYLSEVTVGTAEESAGAVETLIMDSACSAERISRRQVKAGRSDRT